MKINPPPIINNPKTVMTNPNVFFICVKFSVGDDAFLFDATVGKYINFRLSSLIKIGIELVKCGDEKPLISDLTHNKRT